MSLDTFSRYKDNDLDLEPQEEEENLAEQAISEPSFPEIEEDLEKEEPDEDYDPENSSYETPEDKDESELVHHIGSGTSVSPKIPNPLNQSIYSNSSPVTTAPHASPASSSVQPTLSVPASAAASVVSPANQASKTADASLAPVSPKIPSENGSMDARSSEANDSVPEEHSSDKKDLFLQKKFLLLFRLLRVSLVLLCLMLRLFLLKKRVLQFFLFLLLWLPVLPILHWLCCSRFLRCGLALSLTSSANGWLFLFPRRSLLRSRTIRQSMFLSLNLI